MTTEKQTLENQKKIMDTLNTVENRAIRNSEILTSVQKMVEQISYTLNGNGKVGLKEKVGKLETTVYGISGERKKEASQAFQRSMSWRNLGIGILLALAGFIFGILSEWFKHGGL